MKTSAINNLFFTSFLFLFLVGIAQAEHENRPQMAQGAVGSLSACWQLDSANFGQPIKYKETQYKKYKWVTKLNHFEYYILDKKFGKDRSWKFRFDFRGVPKEICEGVDYRIRVRGKATCYGKCLGTPIDKIKIYTRGISVTPSIAAVGVDRHNKTNRKVFKLRVKSYMNNRDIWIQLKSGSGNRNDIIWNYSKKKVEYHRR